MKIIHLVPFYEPAVKFGGPVTVVRNIAEQQQAVGHEVKVITLDLGIPECLPRNQWTTYQNLSVWYQQTGWLDRKPPYPCSSLKRILNETIPWCDVLHIHLAMAYTSFIGIKQAKKHQKATVYTPHGNYCPNRLSQKKTAKTLYHALYEKKALQHASAVQALTEQEAKDTLKAGASKNKIHIIPNGVLRKEYTTGINRFMLRKKLGIPENSSVCIYLGQLIQFKGLDYTVEAYNRIASSLPDSRLLIVGPDKGFKSTIQQMVNHKIHKQVIFQDAVDQKTKNELFAASDFFVLNSRTEGLPMAVIEAAASGLPLLLSPHSHVPEVETFNAGYICENKPEIIADKMSVLFTDSAARIAQAQQAVSMAMQKFSIESVCGELEKLYLNIPKAQSKS